MIRPEDGAFSYHFLHVLHHFTRLTIVLHVLQLSYNCLTSSYTSYIIYMKLFTIILCWWVISGCNGPAESAAVNQRLIYNNDGTETLGNNWFGKRPLTMDDLNGYVDMVAASQVTTYMICSGSDFFYYRSAYGDMLGDDKGGTLDCGPDTALYNNLKRIHANAMIMDAAGTDIVEATLKRVREKKLEAFVTYRMNDLHFADTAKGCPIQYASFWKENPQLWTSDTALKGWNSWNALDFAHPEVRAFKLNIIKEQLEKYGSLIDGYELDFMRFIVYFKKAEAIQNAPLITDLVKSVKSLVDSIGKVHNRKILLTARVPATLDDCRNKGLDVKSWVKAGLVDFLTMGVHWRGEPAMPVADFKKELNSDIPVYATMDDGGYDPREVWSHGMYRGMASHALAQGASGMNLFNYFLTVYNESGQQLKPEPGTLVCRTIAPELLKELGTQETLRKRNKIYCLSDGATSYELTPNSPLPLTIEGQGNLNIYVGDDVKRDAPAEVILFIRTRSKDAFTIALNDTKLELAPQEKTITFDKVRGLKEEQQVLAFSVPVEILKQGDNQIWVSAPDDITIQRVEIALQYGPVEEFGYF